MRRSRSYLAWHPLASGLCLVAATAIGSLVALRLFAAVIPGVDGWPVFTPLNGIVLAVLLMTRRKLWFWVLVGYIAAVAGNQLVPAHIAVGADPRLRGLEIAGSVVELLIAAFTLPPFRNLKHWLLEPRLLPAFAGYALVLGPIVASLAVAQLYPGSAGSVADLHSGFWQRAWIVASSEALGIALATPLVLVLCDGRTYNLFRAKALPMSLGLLALLSIASWVAFAENLPSLMFLTLAGLVLIAFRLELRGAVLATGISAAIATALTASSHTDPLAASATGQFVAIQSYLALAALVVFPLSITLQNRKDLEERLGNAQIELDRLKSIDRLTGVANRKRFDLVLEREWQRATRDPKPVALLIIDTDYFTQYNASYGHQAGDECLRLIASKLADQPHRAYDLISRFEGGKFSVLLPGASGDAVVRIAEEFRSEVAALEWPNATSPFECVTVSVGWASLTPQTTIPAHELIVSAQKALSLAKAKGKNRVEGFANAVPGFTRCE